MAKRLSLPGFIHAIGRSDLVLVQTTFVVMTAEKSEHLPAELAPSDGFVRIGRALVEGGWRAFPGAIGVAYGGYGFDLVQEKKGGRRG